MRFSLCVKSQLFRLCPWNPETQFGSLFQRAAADNWGRIHRILLDPKSANEVDDRRFLAELHFQRGTPADLEEAKILLEEIVIDPTLSSDNDSYHFAMICERLSKQGVGTFATDRDRFKLNRLAGSHFRLIAQSAEPNPQHIEAFVAFLIESNEIDEAIDQWDRLKSIEPNEYITAPLDAKIKRAQRRPQEAIDAILKWQSLSLSLVKPDAPPQRTQEILLTTSWGTSNSEPLTKRTNASRKYRRPTPTWPWIAWCSPANCQSSKRDPTRWKGWWNIPRNAPPRMVSWALPTSC